MSVATKPTDPLVSPSALPVIVKADALPAILCVDDDANILDGLRRHLRKKFQIHTSVGAGEGLEAITKSGPFDVVVSDFQMPGMNGIQFLTKARAIAPDTVRIMLTGQADFSTAMAAVNQGNIFRFLLKPCTPLILEKVLDAGVEQHKLLISEKQLTQRTLLECVQVLVDVLSIVQPEAFSRATRIRRYVRQIAEELGLAGVWQLEAAAMLSQIGWITLSPDLLRKAADHTLSIDQLPAFLAHAAAAARMIEKIPRLDVVASMIEMQHTPLRELPQVPTLDSSGLRLVGAQMLKAAIDFDGLRQKGLAPEDALDSMRREPGIYMPEILTAMTSIERAEAAHEILVLPVSKLEAGMILEENLRSDKGLLVLGKGQEVTATFVERLSNFSYGLSRDEMCRVRLQSSTQ